MGKIIKTAGISFAKPRIAVEVGDTVMLVPEPDNQYDPHAVKIMHGDTKLGYVAKDEEFKEYLFSKGGEFKVALVKYHQDSDDKLWKDVKVGDMVQLSIDSGMDRVPGMSNPLDDIKKIIYRDEGRLLPCTTKLQLISSQPYEVEFDPIDHAYYLNGDKCISGSVFANRFKVEFDPGMVNKTTGLSILEASAKKLGLTVDETKELWSIRGDAGRARGTMFHAYLEAYGKFIKIIKDNPELEEKILPKDNYVRKVVESFFKGRENEIALYEATVWTRINSISCAGEIDRLQIIDVNKKIVRVQDFKTNDDIKKRIGILPPFKGKLKGTELEAYRLQLDFYAAILTKAGYTVDGLDIFHWDQEKDKWITYSFESMDITKEIKL